MKYSIINTITSKFNYCVALVACFEEKNQRESLVFPMNPWIITNETYIALRDNFSFKLCLALVACFEGINQYGNAQYD